MVHFHWQLWLWTHNFQPSLPQIKCLHRMKHQCHLFIKWNINVIKSTLNRAKASGIPINQVFMKLCQTPISPNLPSTMEILHNHLAGPCIPDQKDLAPIDLQRIHEALIHYQQQQKSHNSRKKAKAQPDLHTGQDILYLWSKATGFLVKSAKLAWSPEVRHLPVHLTTTQGIRLHQYSQH